ncbi:hypothetical protein D3C84_1073640 [compost metagenome]
MIRARQCRCWVRLANSVSRAVWRTMRISCSCRLWKAMAVALASRTSSVRVAANPNWALSGATSNKERNSRSSHWGSKYNVR